MIEKKYKFFFAIFLLIALWILMSLVAAFHLYTLSFDSSQNKNAVPHRIVSAQGSYQLIWERMDVDIEKKHEYFIAPVSEKIIVAKNDTVDIINKTDIQSIKFLCPSSVSVNKELIFVGNCFGEVTALDILGNQLWKTAISNEGNITRLIATNDALYSYTEIGNVYSLSLTGLTKYKIDDFGCSNVLITSTAVYSRCDGGISKYDLQSNLLAWKSYLDEPLYGLPLVGNGDVIVTTNPEFRNIFVLDGISGNVIWHTSDSNIVSNVVSQNGLLFYLTATGDLIGRNIRSENIKVKLRLTSTIEETTLFAASYHYLFANDKIIFIYTGDNSQLFAIKIMPQE